MSKLCKSLFCCVCLLSGCAREVALQEQESPFITTARLQIVTAAQEIEQAARQTASLRQNKINSFAYRPNWESSQAEALQKTVSFDWQGSALELLHSLGEKARYQVKEVGTLPHVPLMVEVHAENETIKDILLNINSMIAAYAAIEVHDDQQIIEVRYEG